MGVISRILRLGGLAATLAIVFGLTFVASVGASNHVQYADPAGDNQAASASAYASDIRLVDITSNDKGDVRIAVTLVDGPARLVNGDELDVYVDIDRKQSTGQNGFDIDLVAKGNASGAPSFFLCRLSTPVSCENGVTGFGTDQPTGTNTHIVDFNLSTGIPAFDFAVIASYPNPSGGNALTDVAPNSGVLTYEVKADPDGDGLHGTSDKCPNTKAKGKFDSNGNGCPGLFPFISPLPRAPVDTGRLSNQGLGLFVAPLRITGLPAGARVVISSPRGREVLTARSGTVTSRRAAPRGLALRFGAKITVQVTKAAYVGSYIQLALHPGQGLHPTRRRCIPAVGRQAPVPCSSSLRGR